MTWLSLATAVFAFAKEVFKYLREQEESDRQCAVKIREAGDAIKTARKSKDTSAIESKLRDLNLISGGGKS